MTKGSSGVSWMCGRGSALEHRNRAQVTHEERRDPGGGGGVDECERSPERDRLSDHPEPPRATPSRIGLPAWYPALLDSVAGRITGGRLRATSAVNRKLITTYWAIGRDILGRQEQEGYGTRVIDRLAADIKQRFPEAKGFSPRNLKYMRKFADAWPDPKLVQRSVAQLPRRHLIALLEKLHSPTSGYGMQPGRSRPVGAGTSWCCGST